MFGANIEGLLSTLGEVVVLDVTAGVFLSTFGEVVGLAVTAGVFFSTLGDVVVLAVAVGVFFSTLGDVTAFGFPGVAGFLTALGESGVAAFRLVPVVGLFESVLVSLEGPAFCEMFVPCLDSLDTFVFCLEGPALDIIVFSRDFRPTVEALGLAD